MRELSWLERDDETALLVRRRWTDRAKQRAAMFAMAMDLTDAMYERMWVRINEAWDVEDAIEALIASTRTR